MKTILHVALIKYISFKLKNYIERFLKFKSVLQLLVIKKAEKILKNSYKFFFNNVLYSIRVI